MACAELPRGVEFGALYSHFFLHILKKKKKKIPYRSNIGSGTFQKITHFGDIPRQLFCTRGERNSYIASYWGCASRMVVNFHSKPADRSLF